MLITCKCLNVSMDLGKIKPKGISLASLKLTSVEDTHAFFSEGVAEIESIVGITKQLAALTVSQTIGNWIIETCVNCSQHYYAKHKDKLQSPLISAGLIADPNTVQALKNHPDYSPAFRIVIKQPSERKTLTVEKNSVQSALSGIQQQFGISIKREAEKTDEKIRIYTDQQYESLSKFRERAVNDQEALTKLLQGLKVANETAQSFSGAPKNLPISSNKPINLPDLDDYALSSPRSPRQPATAAMHITGRRTAGRSNSLFNASGVAASFDVEGVFDLEGMDASPPEHVNSEGESDTDHDDSGSHDEGIDLHRKKANPMNLAKSLPVNVPAFQTGGLQIHPVEFQADAENAEPLDPAPMDIAASIKALARSVHGDAVFGDLPRPRFSTQI